MLGPTPSSLLLPPLFTCLPPYYCKDTGELQEAQQHCSRLLDIGGQVKDTTSTSTSTSTSVRRQHELHGYAYYDYTYYGRSETRPRRCCETFARSRPPRATGSRPPQSEWWWWLVTQWWVSTRRAVRAKLGLSATPLSPSPTLRPPPASHPSCLRVICVCVCGREISLVRCSTILLCTRFRHERCQYVSAARGDAGGNKIPKIP